MSKKPFSDKRWTEPPAVINTGKAHFTKDEVERNRKAAMEIFNKNGFEITEEELIEQEKNYIIDEEKT